MVWEAKSSTVGLAHDLIDLTGKSPPNASVTAVEPEVDSTCVCICEGTKAVKVKGWSCGKLLKSIFW